MRTFKYKFDGQDHDVPSRDTFQQKVYNGERIAFGPKWGESLGERTMEDCQAFVDNVLKSATWLRLRALHHKLYSDGTCWIQKRGMTIKDGRGCRWARGGGARITLPMWARTKPVILHEMAHCLVGGGVGHNWPFCRAYIDLVAMFIGKPQAKLLEAGLKKAGARTRPYKRMTSEAKAALAARGRAALLAYAATKQAKPTTDGGAA